MPKRCFYGLFSMVNLSPWIFSVLVMVSTQSLAFAVDDFVYQSSDSLAKDLHDATESMATRASAVSSNTLKPGQIGATLSTPPLPIPNLTMDITLNSALDEELTRYYSEIVQEILKNMPRKVSLHGEQASLLMGSRKYDKLNVIAYLPNQDKGEFVDPLARDIRSFTVDFEVPDMLMAKRLMDDKSGAIPLQRPIVVRKGRYEDFLRRVNSIKSGEEMSSIEEQERALVAHADASSDEFLKGASIGKLQAPKPEPVTAVTKKVVEKSVKPTVSAPDPVPVKEDFVLVESRMEYDADFSNPNGGLATLVGSVKSASDIKKINFIGSVEQSVIVDIASVFNARVQRILSTLDDEGVDTSSLRINSIVLKSKGSSAQSIDVSVVATK